MRDPRVEVVHLVQVQAREEMAVPILLVTLPAILPDIPVTTQAILIAMMTTILGTIDVDRIRVAIGAVLTPWERVTA